MAFHLIVAGSLEPLADRLAAVLADPLDDPFTPELVAVPAGGVKAWLTARLAQRLGGTGSSTAAGDGSGDGIVANVELVFPAGIVERALGEGSGLGRWSTGPLTWAVHEVLQELGPELGQARDAVRARAIADLFDRYTLYRPEMVRVWSEGRDVDGVGAALDQRLHWQPQLWRAVQEHLGGPTDEQLLRRGVQRLAAEGPDPRVPPRVVVFGLASLPTPHLRLLAALAAHREVMVFAPVASPGRWFEVADQLAELTRSEGLALPLERADETVPLGRGSQLVTTWGRASREANLLLLDGARSAGASIEAPDPVPDLGPSPTLLARLQHGLRADEAPPVTALGGAGPGEGSADRRPAFDPATDASLRWHRAYGPARQVEVLRDALLHLFGETDADGSPRFEPRHVAVLCPDPGAVAPLVEAAFAGDEAQGVPAIPVRVADRSLRQDNPVLDTAAALLDLLEGRFRASSVISFASRPPVRRRFGLDAVALTRISEWAEATNVRWGLGATDHEVYGLPGDLGVHTWRAGLDQLLVGSTMADLGPRLGPGDVAPHPGLEGDDVAVAGALADLLDRLEAACAQLRSPGSVDAWCTALADALTDLCDVDDADAWQWRAVEGVIEELRADASVDGRTRAVEVDPSDLAVLLRGRLSTSEGRPRFGTGAVTVSSLTAQRGVPHRVVCLLGLDDAALGGLPSAEDLVAARPCVGDRDPRSEQRAQLLDAVLAAEERLLLFSTGHDIRTNVGLPPAVVVAELLDLVDATVRLADSSPPSGSSGSTEPSGVGAERARASAALTVDHPRQAWSERALGAPGPHLDRLSHDGPWSFDRGARDAALARRAQRSGDVTFLPEPLPPAPTPTGAGAIGGGAVPVLPIDELVTACTNAPELLLRHRLGIVLPSDDDDRDDAIPLELGGLDEWKVIDRLLSVRLAADPDELAGVEAVWEEVERRRGAVPPLAFGGATLEEARRRVDALQDRLAAELGRVAYEPVPVSLDALDAVVALSSGPRRLSGTVSGVCGDLVVTVTPSRLKPKDHLRSWVRVAALTAADPSRRWEAVVVARKPGGGDRAATEAIRVSLLEPDLSLEVLDLLDDLHRRARADVVPAFAHTGEALWCKGLAAARAAWTKMFDGEAEDRWVNMAVGSEFDAVLDLPLRPDEPGRPGPGGRLQWWTDRIWGAYERTTGIRLRSDAEAAGA
jgi:exodeoxyribonuclease V gamma subunit